MGFSFRLLAATARRSRLAFARGDEANRIRFRAFLETAWRFFIAAVALAIFAPLAIGAEECVDSRSGLVILGMAKSSTDLNGAKAQKVELDFLRLVYAKQTLRARSVDVAAYLLVMVDDVASRTHKWARDYDVEGLVEVLVADLSDEDLNRLRAEKKANADGNKAAGGKSKQQASAKFGEKLGESELRRQIMARHPEAIEITRKECRPFKVQWDFFGRAPK